jgi:Lrp/AsnC family transcriptional regulator
LLQENASLSTAAIAEEVGLSPSPCWRRIDRLERDGIINRRVAIVDGGKIGLGTEIFALVTLNAHGRSNIEAFSAAIQEFPEVLECFVLMGSVDYLLRVVTTDIEAYEQFLYKKLSQLPGVQGINSMVALTTIKSTTALPI